jgi:hypothetical protein
MPGWLLADYLVDLGGDRVGDDRVVGDGWSATLERHERPAGSLTIGRVTVTIEGPEADGIMALLRAKAQRGGG